MRIIWWKFQWILFIRKSNHCEMKAELSSPIDLPHQSLSKFSRKSQMNRKRRYVRISPCRVTPADPAITVEPSTGWITDRLNDACGLTRELIKATSEISKWNPFRRPIPIGCRLRECTYFRKCQSWTMNTHATYVWVGPVIVVDARGKSTLKQLCVSMRSDSHSSIISTQRPGSFNAPIVGASESQTA